MRSQDLVHDYFNREARRFDAIYDQDKPLLERLADAAFRRVVLERYSLVVNALGATGATVLDVGCGPGRYGIELARRGARHCVGVDVSPNMIALARRASEHSRVVNRCEWHVGDWLEFDVAGSFEAVIAMGYFDYLEEPLPHLRKMIDSAPRGRVFASFPKRLELRAPLRALRFKLSNGFVRFYSRSEVRKLFAVAGGLAYLAMVDLGRDYVAIYDAGAARNRD